MKKKKNIYCPGCNVREKVLNKIKNQKIRMHSPCIFIAKKIGLESACAFFIVLGALFIGLFFYFLRKKEILGMGFLKTESFPLYSYIILFMLSIGLAVFFANRTEIFCGGCQKTRKFIFYFFLIALVLGMLLGML